MIEATERKQLVLAHLALVGAAVLFGTTFVVVKDAVTDVQPVPFLAVRFLIGAAALWPLARRAPRQTGITRAGWWCGIALLAGYLFQTVGLQYTTSSKSAFITYLLVVIVPVLSAVVLRRLPAPATLIGIVVATAGLWLLDGGRFSLGRGELLTLGCAVAFAVHVVLLAEWSARFDTVRLTAIQLFVVGAACLVPGLFFGGYRFTAAAFGAAVFTGLAASAGAFFLQLYGQRVVAPTRAALLLTLEPVFAAMVGYVIGDRLGAKGLAGAALILLGVLVAEVPSLLTARSAA